MTFTLLAQALGNVAGEAEQNIAAEAGKQTAATADPMDKLRSLQFDAISSEEWLDLGISVGLGAVVVIVLVVLAWMISGWFASLVRRGLNRVKFDQTLTLFLSKLVRWLILLLVVLTCLSYFGIETTSFAALIGAAGLAVGLAFQGTLSNFSAGAMLLIFRPYKVGDIVNVAGFLGIVKELALFTTDVDTFDGRRVIIPNSSIYGSVIENITYHPHRRVDIDVGAAYDADIDATREALQQAIASVEYFLEDPAPAVMLMGLGGSSVDWSVRAWALNDNWGDARQALIQAVKQHLDGANIGIPYPQMDVHLDSGSGENAASQ